MIGSKKRIIGLIVILTISMGFTNGIYGQSFDDLNIFGFSQVVLNSRYTDVTLFESTSIPVEINTKSYSNSFALHQVNIFFQKPITESASFFLNMEATGSYSTKTPSGNLEIPEGWISFSLTDELELKTGLLLPRFNNLNEIQNRLPLFPYIIRPMIYETYLVNIFDPEDYLPGNAYVQLSGYQNFTHRLNFDYAFFIGNAEKSFLSSVPAGTLGTEEESTALYQGENLNTQLLYGGRIGIENRYKTFKFGTSFTIDEDNKTASNKRSARISELELPILGEVPRYRIGIDHSFKYKKWAFETEFIGVFHNHEKIHRIRAFEQVDLNKYFFYTNFSYNFTSNFYVYGYQSYLQNNQTLFLVVNPPHQYHVSSFGGGWKINDVTVFKIQSAYSFDGPNDFIDFMPDL